MGQGIWDMGHCVEKLGEQIVWKSLEEKLCGPILWKKVRFFFLKYSVEKLSVRLREKFGGKLGGKSVQCTLFSVQCTLYSTFLVTKKDNIKI